MCSAVDSFILKRNVSPNFVALKPKKDARFRLSASTKNAAFLMQLLAVLVLVI